MIQVEQSSIRNHILAALPATEFALLAGDLRHVDLALGAMLHQARHPVDDIYFIENGFISALAVLPDGRPLEIGLIGSEGAAGALVVLGATIAYDETMCRAGGEAHCIPVIAFKQALEASPVLKDLMLRYVLAFHVQAARTTACNAHHDLPQRLSSWLLAAHDRSGVPELSMTEDLIAVMLGVGRSTVSAAAGTLQKAGLIRCRHGKITILDRIGLEDAACECYEAVANEYRRLCGEDVAAGL